MHSRMTALMLSLLCVLISNTQAQSPPDPFRIQTQDVRIARDSFGIPHIIGKTHADAIYGLAWAHAEDDFRHIQHNLLPARGNLGRAIGKKGVLFDYAVRFLKIDEYVRDNYEKEISPDFDRILRAYCQALNDYAQKYPKEVLVPRALPFTPHDVISGYTVNLCLMSGVGMALKAINDNMIERMYAPNNRGSNAIALAPFMTEDQSTWLCINSHQPLEGPFAWYEAHLMSDEGLNISGGLFPGCVSIMLGANEKLGWAHTVNYNQWGDIYALQINPDNKNQYWLDGQYLDLEQRKAKFHVRLGPIVIGAKRKLEYSRFGPVFRTKHGTYALRFHAYENIGAAEQWFNMNLAGNFQEFEDVIKKENITSFNIVYADKQGNIYFHSNGAYPLRQRELNWNNPIAGADSRMIWDQLLPFEEKPTVLNPDCGYVYNANNTPLLASGPDCNWKGDFPGLQLFTYNRGERLEHLLQAREEPWTWEDFLALKFDKRYHPGGMFEDRFRTLIALDPQAHPDLADAIRAYQQWNMECSADNRSAALPMVTHYFLNKQSPLPFAYLMIREEPLSKEQSLKALESASKLLMKHYGRLDPELGEVQRYMRGDHHYPAGGGYEVLRAADPSLVHPKKGRFRINSGDGYMQMIRFHPDRPLEMYAIHPYGSSAHPQSLHYADQMPMFAAEQFRRVSLDRDSALAKAVHLYHPGAIVYR